MNHKYSKQWRAEYYSPFTIYHLRTYYNKFYRKWQRRKLIRKPNGNNNNNSKWRKNNNNIRTENVMPKFSIQFKCDIKKNKIVSNQRMSHFRQYRFSSSSFSLFSFFSLWVPYFWNRMVVGVFIIFHLHWLLLHVICMVYAAISGNVL